MIAVREHEDGISFQVKLHPRARKNAITGEMDGALKLSLNAPASEGRANQACIEFLAKFLKVPRSSIRIASGEHNRLKVIQLAGLTMKQLRERLAVG